MVELKTLNRNSVRTTANRRERTLRSVRYTLDADQTPLLDVRLRFGSRLTPDLRSVSSVSVHSLAELVLVAPVAIVSGARNVLSSRVSIRIIMLRREFR